MYVKIQKTITNGGLKSSRSESQETLKQMESISSTKTPVFYLILMKSGITSQIRTRCNTHTM